MKMQWLIPFCVLFLAHFSCWASVRALGPAVEYQISNGNRRLALHSLRDNLITSSILHGLALACLLLSTFEGVVTLLIFAVPFFYCPGLIAHAWALMRLLVFGSAETTLPNGHVLKTGALTFSVGVSFLGHLAMAFVGPFMWAKLALHGRIG